MKIIFVDGYNVLNSWPQLRDAKDHNFEGARQSLIDILQNYAAYKGYKIFLVFDGHLVKGSLENKEKLGNLTIVFTKQGETADSYIERSVNDIGRKANVCVVTSDSLEQQLIFQRGATRKSSLEFMREVNLAQNKIRTTINSEYSTNKNSLEDFVEKDILEKLEKMRRSR